MISQINLLRKKIDLLCQHYLCRCDYGAVHLNYHQSHFMEYLFKFLKCHIRVVGKLPATEKDLLNN